MSPRFDGGGKASLPFRLQTRSAKAGSLIHAAQSIVSPQGDEMMHLVRKQEAFPSPIVQTLRTAPREGQTGTADPTCSRRCPPGGANVQAQRAAAL
jgi:hypothetical protein